MAVEANDVRSGAAAAAITDLRAAADGSLELLQGTQIEYSEDGTVALISIPTEGSGNDQQSTAALDVVRNEIVPDTIGAVDGATVNVSGSAAQSKDFRDLVSDRLPLVFGFVFLLAFLLMLVTFRSIVIPIKAILLNLLSVGAAYGVLVLVFQDGHGEGLLGFSSNGGVTSWLPLFLFVILFGLSMDYHIFILSRVREAYLRGMSTTEAVRHGISTTAGTVSRAAHRDGGRVLGVRHPELPRLQADGRGAGGGRAYRRHDRARRAAAGVDEGARRLELVPPELARMAASGRLRGRRGPAHRAGRARGARPAERRRRATARAGSRVGAMTQTARRVEPAEPAQADTKGPAMNTHTPRLRPVELAFIIGVPAAWAILLLFHPLGEGGFYEVIDGNVTAWLTVHLGMGIFVPLFAGVIWLLLRGVTSTAATVSRIGLAVFAVLYAAWELVLGVGTGILAQEVNALPASDQAAGAALVDPYAENGVIVVLSVLGSLGLGVAMIAAAVALRSAYGLGWASLVLTLLAIPLIAVHEPPFGPVGLAIFIGAVLLFVRQGAAAPARSARPLEQPVAAGPT